MHAAMQVPFPADSLIDVISPSHFLFRTGTNPDFKCDGGYHFRAKRNGPRIWVGPGFASPGTYFVPLLSKFLGGQPPRIFPVRIDSQLDQ